MSKTKCPAPTMAPATVFPSQAITYNGKIIHISEEMNLTEIHRASGKTSTYKPIQWICKEGSTFLASQQKKVLPGHLLIRSEKGRKGGTIAHWQISMEYARYLSPELAAVCNQIVKDFVDAKPEIAMSVTSRTSEKGKAKIAVRDVVGEPSPELRSRLGLHQRDNKIPGRFQQMIYKQQTLLYSRS